jgi:threonine dehydrogenase-like Zn-dependent dehydrogenase
MKAVVFHGIGDIRLDDVPDPQLQEPTDAIVRLTRNAICGTDLHRIRGTMAGMQAGTILGHEGVGIVEEVGQEVRNLQVGDRVVIPSTIACGYLLIASHHGSKKPVHMVLKLSTLRPSIRLKPFTV